MMEGMEEAPDGWKRKKWMPYDAISRLKSGIFCMVE
jgi:hypothetical protein